MPTMQELLEEVLDNLSRIKEPDLSKLEAGVSAERQERELAKGRGKPDGANSPAPAAQSILARCGACGYPIPPAPLREGLCDDCARNLFEEVPF